MSGSLITISVAGLIAGFLFSMPIAGPISFLVTSNALKGRLRYCNFLTVGASFADLVYVFLAVFGLTRFYSMYKPVIPYLMGAGSVFLVIIGYTIFKSKIDPEKFSDEIHLPKRIKEGGHSGFYTGFFVNFLNPTLFFGWLTTSFIVISIVSSLGFNTGGMNLMIDQNIAKINSIQGKAIEKPELPGYLKFDTLHVLKKETPVKKAEAPPKETSHLIISLCFAVSLSLGSIIWFYLLALFICRHRKSINIKILNLAINSLGIVLCLFGVFLIYKAINLIL
jgi:threonine/homoserine/homoserine lactone efflux protein